MEESEKIKLLVLGGETLKKHLDSIESTPLLVNTITEMQDFIPKMFASIYFQRIKEWTEYQASLCHGEHNKAYEALKNYTDSTELFDRMMVTADTLMKYDPGTKEIMKSKWN